MSYDSVILADSPVAYYTLADTSGTNAVDSSGNAVTGTYSGAFSLNAAAITAGLGPSVNLTGGKMVVPDAAPNRIGGSAMTIEAWINASALPGYATLIEGAASQPNRFYAIFLNALGGANTYYGAFGSNLGADALPMGGTLATGTAYHLVFAYDGTSCIGYVNTVGATPTQPGHGSANDNVGFQIGQTVAGGGTTFQGQISNLALYNFQLSPTQVTAHFAAATATFIPTTAFSPGRMPLGA